MTVIVRQLKEYHTNRSPAFIASRCFLLDAPVNLNLKYFEIAVEQDLNNYYFYVCDQTVDAALIKRTISRYGIDNFVLHNKNNTVRWNGGNATEMDWSNPPKEPKMAVLVQMVRGVPDFTAPALFMYVPKTLRPRRTKLKKIPKGTGPIPYRL